MLRQGGCGLSRSVELMTELGAARQSLQVLLCLMAWMIWAELNEDARRRRRWISRVRDHENLIVSCRGRRSDRSSLFLPPSSVQLIEG